MSNLHAEAQPAPPAHALRRPGREWRVLLAVFAALAVCEAGVRAGQSRLSADLVHYAEMPGVVRGLARSAPPRVLFVGNSLIREGLDPRLFAAEVARLEPGVGPVSVGRLHPDDTSVVEWRRLVERYFPADAAPPAELLVVGYAQNQLTDRSIVRPRRLGGYYAAPGNLRSMLASDAARFDDRAELLVACLSKSFAAAERVRLRVLDALVPHYRDAAPVWNAGTRAPAPPGPAPPETYDRLGALLDAADAAGARVALVAIPVGEPYEIDPALVELASSRRATHLDARQLPGVGPENFPDGYHMDRAASARFTDLVARGLAAQLAAAESPPEWASPRPQRPPPPLR